MAGTTVAIPLLDYWGGLEAYTLLLAGLEGVGVESIRPVVEKSSGGVVAYAEVHVPAVPDDVAKAIEAPFKGERIEARMPCADKGPRLERRGPGSLKVSSIRTFTFTRYDIDQGDKYFVQVMKNLCYTEKPVNDATLGEIASAAAAAVRGECPTAMEPVTAMGLLRAEYYRFARTLGGKPGNMLDTKGLKVPSIAQALAVLGHAYTLVYREARESRHLAAYLPPGLEARTYSHASSLYTTVSTLLSRAWASWSDRGSGSSGVPWQVQSLLVGMASACSVSGAELADLLVEAKVGGGNTITLYNATPIVASPVHRLLQATLEPREMRRLAWAAYNIASLTAQRVEGCRPSRRDFNPRRHLAKVLTEYAQGIVQHAQSLASGGGSVDYAYAAARAAYEGYEAMAANCYRAEWLLDLSTIAARAAKAGRESVLARP